MFPRSIVWINSLLILIEINESYARTYADVYYGRIRDRSETTGLSAGVIFLILFGCIVGGFFVVCILGTIILELYDFVS
ncbi:hypothetical protein I4U23_020898 [Adineta vaga]|nr:hypothetical protein I4U23_020898 [Adineta vaga]